MKGLMRAAPSYVLRRVSSVIFYAKLTQKWGEVARCFSAGAVFAPSVSDAAASDALVLLFAEREARLGGTSNVNRFKRIAVIVNPAAKNGAGAEAARRVADELRRAFGTSDAFDVMLTEESGHAIEIAKSLHSAYGTVITVGGDGLIHEVANGFMQRDECNRPMLGVVPVGSGNDYAATLGMSSKIDRAIQQILDCNVVEADVGCVNGEYFVETVSFGVDAAIALDTVGRRRRTGRTGTLLYLESGIDQLFHHLDPVSYQAVLHGVQDLPGMEDEKGGEGALEESGSGRSAASFPQAKMEAATGPAEKQDASADLVLAGGSYIFAVQIGPTYGGHFKVCPQACIDDGLFDLCLAHPPLNSLTATGIFLLAKGGRHTRFSQIEMHRARSLDVAFEGEPPAQADGERLRGSQFHIEMVPHALRVFVGAAHS